MDHTNYKTKGQIDHAMNIGITSIEVEAIEKMQRLAKRYHRIAIADCNGYGRIGSQAYYNGEINDYAKRQYGDNVKSAYVSDDVTVWDLVSEKLLTNIKDIICKLNGLTTGRKWHIETQGDPRGNMIFLYCNAKYVIALDDEI